MTTYDERNRVDAKEYTFTAARAFHTAKGKLEYALEDLRVRCARSSQN